MTCFESHNRVVLFLPEYNSVMKQATYDKPKEDKFFLWCLGEREESLSVFENKAERKCSLKTQNKQQTRYLKSHAVLWDNSSVMATPRKTFCCSNT